MTKLFEMYDVNDWLDDEYSDTIEVPINKANLSRNFPKKHISRKEELKYIIELSSEEERNESKKHSNSIYKIIARRSRIEFNQREKNESNYSNLIRLSLGKQLFNYIESDFFPKNNSFNYYLARFYSCVVLRKVVEANHIYPEISKYLEKIICKNIVPNSQIVGNIRCLYYLLSKHKKEEEILEENMSLINMSTNYKHAAMCSILLLNRSRLFRSLAKYGLAEEALHQSYKLVSNKGLWKQSLYYILQQSLIKQEKERLINLCIDSNISNQNHQDCFGWRLTKLLTGKSCYAYGYYAIPQKIKDILTSKYSLCTKYKCIISDGQNILYSV